MSNLVDHPGRPSVAMHRYAAQCYAKAGEAKVAGDGTSEFLWRLVGNQVRAKAVTAEGCYEKRVSDLVFAALDVLDGGGFAGDLDQALAELRRAVNTLRGHTQVGARS